MLDVIIGRHTSNCQIRTHIHTGYTDTRTHMQKKKSRKIRTKGRKNHKKTEGGSGKKERREKERTKRKVGKRRRKMREKGGEEKKERGRGMGLGG